MLLLITILRKISRNIIFHSFDIRQVFVDDSFVCIAYHVMSPYSFAPLRTSYIEDKMASSKQAVHVL